MIDDLVEIWLLLSFLLRGDMVHYYHSMTGDLCVSASVIPGAGRVKGKGGVRGCVARLTCYVVLEVVYADPYKIPG